MIEDKQRVLDTLNGILELEMAGVVRYVHYSLMIFGYSRIPVVKWMRDQATESMTHAAEAGERITALGGHPSLKIGKLLETHHHGVQEILVDEAPVIPLFWYTAIDPVTTRLHNFRPNATQSADTWNAAQWYLSGASEEISAR